MLREPRLVRRPIVDANGTLLIGADPKSLDASIG